MNIETYIKEIDVDTYIRDYVNVEEFLEMCKKCPNYEKVWSCPPFDFSPKDYLKQFKSLTIIAKKIILSEEERVGDWNAAILKVKKELTQELFQMEESEPGSVSLSAGHCEECGEVCMRAHNLPCSHKDKMRYSIEALGGNVGLTISKLMNIELEWVTEGSVPEYYVLVGGLLTGRL